MSNSKDDLERLNLIAKILNDYSLSAVEISDNGFKYRVEKESLSTAECDVNRENSKATSLKDIASPLTGIFYSSISPESEAFVKAEQMLKNV